MNNELLASITSLEHTISLGESHWQEGYLANMKALLSSLIKDARRQEVEQAMRNVYIEAYGHEFDDESRKQSPLPIYLAYRVALIRMGGNHA